MKMHVKWLIVKHTVYEKANAIVIGWSILGISLMEETISIDHLQIVHIDNFVWDNTF